MFGRRVPLNREQLAFLAAACALAAAGVWAVSAGPGFPPAGEQRTGRSAPGELGTGLEALGRPEGADTFLVGHRDPFARYQESPTIARSEEPKPRPQPIPVRIVPPDPFATKTQAKSTVIKPYQIPVNYQGIMVTNDERHVVLKLKQNGQNRRLVEGDVWPEVGLRIVKITQNWVLLQDDKDGQLYKMRDAYGGRPGADAEVASLEAGRSQ